MTEICSSYSFSITTHHRRQRCLQPRLMTRGQKLSKLGPGRTPFSEPGLTGFSWRNREIFWKYGFWRNNTLLHNRDLILNFGFQCMVWNLCLSKFWSWSRRAEVLNSWYETRFSSYNPHMALEISRCSNLVKSKSKITENISKNAKSCLIFRIVSLSTWNSEYYFPITHMR